MDAESVSLNTSKGPARAWLANAQVHGFSCFEGEHTKRLSQCLTGAEGGALPALFSIAQCLKITNRGTSANATNRSQKARNHLSSTTRGTSVQTVRHSLGWFSQDTCQTLKTRLHLQRVGSTDTSALDSPLSPGKNTHLCLAALDRTVHSLVVSLPDSSSPGLLGKPHLVTGSTSFTVHQLKMTK